jgi:hypothetical protein
MEEFYCDSLKDVSIIDSKLVKGCDENKLTVGIYKKCEYKLVQGVARGIDNDYFWYNNGRDINFELNKKEIVSVVGIYSEDIHCIIDYRDQSFKLYEDNILIVKCKDGQITTNTDKKVTMFPEELNKSIHIKDYKTLPISFDGIEFYQEMLRDPIYLEWYNKLKNS